MAAEAPNQDGAGLTTAHASGCELAAGAARASRNPAAGTAGSAEADATS